MSLTAAVLTHTPPQPAALPANLGRAAQAWFLDQVRAADHALAESLHAPNQERPYTVSNVWRRVGARGPRPYMPGEGSPRPDDEPRVQPGDALYLRLTTYETALTSLLRQRLLPDLPDVLTLAGLGLHVTGFTTAAQDHPWAGATEFTDLVQRHTLAQQPAPGLELHFASPTVFHSQEVFVPLPLPRLVFEGLVRRWNAVAPIALPTDVVRYAEECLVISRYRLHTERVSFGEQAGRGAYPGFVGHCAYAFRVKDRYWMGLIHTLAAFAFYAGVGKGTAMGMGQCRKVER